MYFVSSKIFFGTYLCNNASLKLANSNKNCIYFEITYNLGTEFFFFLKFCVLSQILCETFLQGLHSSGESLRTRKEVANIRDVPGVQHHRNERLAPSLSFYNSCIKPQFQPEHCRIIFCWRLIQWWILSWWRLQWKHHAVKHSLGGLTSFKMCGVFTDFI